MPRLDARIVHLRTITCEAVQRLIDCHRATSECNACQIIYHSAKKRAATGFKMTTFQTFYFQYKNFKRTYGHLLQSTPHEEFP